tara:strand:- start:4455 stop:4832 length:378 start_codon:yes stop_codon:yes gene_type:complete
MEDLFYFNVLQKLNERLKNFNKNKKFRFIFQDKLSFAVTNLIAKQQFKHKPIYYEEICRLVPHYFGSRSTIQLLLNDGVVLEIYHKTNHVTDKRLRVYNIHKNFMPEYKTWLDFIASRTTKHAQY